MKIKPVTRVNEMPAYRQQQRKQMPTRDAFEIVLELAKHSKKWNRRLDTRISPAVYQDSEEAIFIVEDYMNDLIKKELDKDARKQ